MHDGFYLWTNAMPIHGIAWSPVAMILYFSVVTSM